MSWVLGVRFVGLFLVIPLSGSLTQETVYHTLYSVIKFTKEFYF